MTIPTTGPFTVAEKEAAKRASDIVNEALASESWELLVHCWLAIRLSDGGSDYVLYESRAAAVRHQLHENLCAYISFRTLGPGGAKWSEMIRVLRFHRAAYEKGMRLVDPETSLAPTSGQMDYIHNLVRGVVT